MSTDASSRSALLPLVDALTMGGDDAPALLIQHEPDWAAVAVKPSGILLVVLDARRPESWDLVLTRVSAVLRTERPEVLAGFAEGVMAVALYGSPVGAAELATAPLAAPELGRFVHWMVVGPSRGVVPDARPGPTPAAATLFKEIDKIVYGALERPAIAGARGPAGRAEIERVGEAALAAEARFRGAMQKKTPPVTIALLVACVVMMGLEYLFGALDGSGVARMGAVSGRLVKEGHVEGLLAYAMLHGSLLHILMNGLALQALGRMLENLIGGRRFLFVFTLSALGGGALTALLKPEQLVVGASGGIFGLMTAVLALTLRRGGELPTLARQRLRQALASTLLFNVGVSLLPGISLLGHAGGGIVGFLIGISGVVSAGVAVPWKPAPEPAKAARMNAIFRVAGAACAIAIAASVAVALARGRPWAAKPEIVQLLRIEGTSFVVNVPAHEQVRRETLQPHDVHHVTVGALQLDPLLVEIRSVRLPLREAEELSSDAALREYFDARRSTVTVDAAPQATSLGGVRAVVLDGKTKSGAPYARWVFMDQGVLVDAEAILVPGAGEGWRAAMSAAAPRRAP